METNTTMTVNLYTATGRRAVENVPAKFEKRDFNPCFDVILVPDVDHPDCPKILVDALSLNTFLGPMMEKWETIDGKEYRVMSRYEDQVIYDTLSA